MRDAAGFVRAFAEYWAAPTLEGLESLLRTDVVLVQPLAPRMCGLASVKEEFARIFALLPDLHGTVDRWSAVDDTVFIEFRLRGTLGGAVVEWPLLDRFVLSDGMAIERVSYFDPTALVGAALRRPSSWPGVVRSGLWRRLLNPATAAAAQ